MPEVRLVNHAVFHSDDNGNDVLITGGIRGVHVFKFGYHGKYNPKLASQVDPRGRYIDIELVQGRTVDRTHEWTRGLKVDSKNDLIISWDKQFVSFN